MKKQVKTKYGLIEGEDFQSYTVYRGIPYAKPPCKELRWREPQDVEPWEGVYHADSFSDMCVQELPNAEQPITGRFAKEFYNNKDFLPEMSEDCLYLNIWAPHGTNGGKFPVAFWIHGGGFGGGFGSELEFDGKAFCEKGVILVTVNYRVNVFGFLAHPWLSAENERGISGNYGCLDQIKALKWVYENIGAFGGDASNITVFGQSAGSMSTQILISSELTGNIPAKAIMQSGITCREELLYTPTLREAEENGERIVSYTGAKNLEELRSMPANKLFEAKCSYDAEAWKLGKGLTIVPNADGYLLKETVGEIWKHGKMKNIPYMLGSVTDDLGALPEDVREGKPGILQEECIRFSVRAEEAFGKPAYVYYFSHPLPGDDWGAFHSCELWYMMGTLDRCWRPMAEEDYRLSEEMVTYWTNFIKYGVPASAAQEDWRPCSAEEPFVKIFK